MRAMKKGGDTYDGLMGVGSDRPLLRQGESRGPMLVSIGTRLREFYARETPEELPDHLSALLKRLGEANPGGSQDHA